MIGQLPGRVVVLGIIGFVVTIGALGAVEHPDRRVPRGLRRSRCSSASPRSSSSCSPGRPSGSACSRPPWSWPSSRWGSSSSRSCPRAGPATPSVPRVRLDPAQRPRAAQPPRPRPRRGAAERRHHGGLGPGRPDRGRRGRHLPGGVADRGRRRRRRDRAARPPVRPRRSSARTPSSSRRPGCPPGPARPRTSAGCGWPRSSRSPRPVLLRLRDGGRRRRAAEPPSAGCWRPPCATDPWPAPRRPGGPRDAVGGPDRGVEVTLLDDSGTDGRRRPPRGGRRRAPLHRRARGEARARRRHRAAVRP